MSSLRGSVGSVSKRWQTVRIDSLRVWALRLRRGLGLADDAACLKEDRISRNVQTARREGTGGRLRLRVTRAAESMIRAGHPWLFAESIREQNRAGAAGDLGVVYDRNDKFLAIGLFDPESPIRVRVLQAGKPVTIDHAWWRARLEQAQARREGLFDGRTTGYRYIHGESDGWPGLVLDRYEGTLVLKLYTGAWLPRLPEVAGMIDDQFGPERLVLRLSRNIQKAAGERFGVSDGSILCGPPLEGPVVFSESGLRFEADVLKGQKTGFFLDQRENRRRVETLATGRATLNAFSFSGGFSLYAARGGAASVTDLDISAHALKAGDSNFARNQAIHSVARCRREGVQCDVFDWLKGNSERMFGLIILDPPSFAKRECEKAEALGAYGRLVTSALKHLSPGGILAACSCSAHVTSEEFFAAVRQAASKSRRNFAEAGRTFHPSDHPATFKEAQYLKALYLRFGDFF